MLEGSNYTIVKARTNKKVACVYINDQCIFICYIYRGVQPKTEKNIAVQLAPSSCDLKMIFYMICTLQFLFVSLILVTIKS